MIHTDDMMHTGLKLYAVPPNDRLLSKRCRFLPFITDYRYSQLNAFLVTIFFYF